MIVRGGALSLAAVLLMAPMVVQAEWVSESWEVMGTRASVEFWRPPQASGKAIVDDIKAEFSRLNAQLSPWVETSDISRINSGAGQAPVAVSAETYRLIETAHAYSVLTDGAFDITFAGVGALYDYRAGVQPDEHMLGKTLDAISFLNLELLPGLKVQFNQDAMRIDLGGIAKGYAIDRAIAIFKDAGVEHAWVSLGGDSFVLGDRRGRLWQVGIRHPRDAQAVAITMPVEDIAVSTSGDYERFFIADGERVHHIINPDTGRPAGELSSVTILADSAIQADALSTSVFVLGMQRGLALVNQLEGVSAIIIDRQGDVSYSDDLDPSG